MKCFNFCFPRLITSNGHEKIRLLICLFLCSKVSSVDRRPLDGVRSVRLQQDMEFESDGRSIRCSEVNPQHSSRSLLVQLLWSNLYLNVPSGFLPVEDSRLQPCVGALVLPGVSEGDGVGCLQRSDSSPRSSRVQWNQLPLASCLHTSRHGSDTAMRWARVLLSTGADVCVSVCVSQVEYQAGSAGRLLPQRYMNELDSALIPVIHGGSASVPQTPMDMEFTFYITHTI